MKNKNLHPDEQQTPGDGPLRYLLTAYLFDNVSDAGKKEVEEHLEASPESRAELAELRDTLASIEDALGDTEEESAKYSFEARRLERVLAASKQRPWYRPRVFLSLAAAAALLIACIPLFTGFGGYARKSARTRVELSRLGIREDIPKGTDSRHLSYQMQLLEKGEATGDLDGDGYADLGVADGGRSLNELQSGLSKSRPGLRSRARRMETTESRFLDDRELALADTGAETSAQWGMTSDTPLAASPAVKKESEALVEESLPRAAGEKSEHGAQRGRSRRAQRKTKEALAAGDAKQLSQTGPRFFVQRGQDQNGNLSVQVVGGVSEESVDWNLQRDQPGKASVTENVPLQSAVEPRSKAARGIELGFQAPTEELRQIVKDAWFEENSKGDATEANQGSSFGLSGDDLASIRDQVTSAGNFNSRVASVKELSEPLGSQVNPYNSNNSLGFVPQSVQPTRQSAGKPVESRPSIRDFAGPELKLRSPADELVVSDTRSNSTFALDASEEQFLQFQTKKGQAYARSDRPLVVPSGGARIRISGGGADGQFQGQEPTKPSTVDSRMLISQR